LAYVFKTIKDNPFSARRHFDLLFFGSTTGVSLKVKDKWFGRINDHFVLEYDDRSLILDNSSRRHYKTPRFPKSVRCHDYINLSAALRSRMFGRISPADAGTVAKLVSLLKRAWGDQLKGTDYSYFEAGLQRMSSKLPYLHRLYEKLFDRVRPRIIFIEDGSYGGVYAWIMKWARDCGIVTAELQHGCIDIPYMYGDRLLHNAEFGTYVPEYLLLYGQYWADLVRSPSRKVIIGNPHFDTKKAELVGVKREGSGKSVLVISQGIVTTAMVELTCRLAKLLEQSGHQIIFRLHPGEIPFVERYRKLEGISNVRIDKDGDIYRLMHEADHVVGTSSLALFEAVGLNKKLYVLESADSAAYVPQDIGLRFKDADELFDLISHDKYHLTRDTEIYWAGNWRENFRRFVDPILEKQGSATC
jgi:hypothetical protein